MRYTPVRKAIIRNTCGLNSGEANGLIYLERNVDVEGEYEHF